MSEQPRYAAHTATLMRQLAGERKFDRAAARALTADRIHA
jgi:hypothetical protein